MHTSSIFTTSIGLRTKGEIARLPRPPHKSASRGTTISGLSDSLTLQPARLLASQADLTESCYPSQPTETFTSKLSMGWSPAPPLDITTAVTGQFCRWVSHPLEQRLALLQAFSGGFKYSPTTSVSFSRNFASRDSLKFLIKWGLRL